MKSDWKIKKLGDFLTLEYGKPLDKKLRKSEGKYPVYGANGIKDRSDEYYHEKETIIVGRKGSAGELTLTESRFWPLDVTYFLKFDPKKYDLRFLYNLLSCLNLPDLATGVKPGINRNNIYQISVSIPDITEQKRIVAILDKAFAAIDKAKANAEQNLKNARELFESCAQMLFKNGNWKHKSIEEVCDDIFAGGDAPKGNFSPKKNAKYQIPIYANSVKDRGLYGYTDFSRVTTPSLTISARGSGTGHTEIRLERYLPIVRLIVLIPKLPLMNLDFLKYSIDNLEIMRSGSAIPQLTVPMIKKYKIPLPSITEQREIVQQLQALCNQTKKSEEIYKVKINKLEELKTSILQKAFSGELTSASAEVALA